MIQKEDMKKLIENELDNKNGVVQLIASPNDDCLACMIGDFWFYFVGSEYEDLTPNEAYETFTCDELADMIYDTMQDLGDDERHYYESVLMETKERNNAFDSYQHETNKIVLLDEVDDDGFPMIAVCRENKDLGGGLYINEISSIYEKQNLENMIERSFNKNKKFYKNKKTEQYIKSRGLQLPKGLTYALFKKYYNESFTKCQVEQDLLKDNGRELYSGIVSPSPKVYVIDQTEVIIHNLIEQYNNKTHTILNSKNINKIQDGDTLLADVIEQNVKDRGYDYNGFFEDILNIYQTSADKSAVCEMFYEFTGIEFEDFLEQAIEEQKKTMNENVKNNEVRR